METVNYVLNSRPVTFLTKREVAPYVYGAMIQFGDTLRTMSVDVHHFNGNGSIDNTGCNMNNVSPGSSAWLAGVFIEGLGIVGLGATVLVHTFRTVPNNQNRAMGGNPSIVVRGIHEGQL